MLINHELNMNTMSSIAGLIVFEKDKNTLRYLPYCQLSNIIVVKS